LACEAKWSQDDHDASDATPTSAFQRVIQRAVIHVQSSGAEQQKKLDMSRSVKAPRRRGQKNHMFKVG